MKIIKKSPRRIFILILLGAFALIAEANEPAKKLGWQPLGKGIELGIFRSPFPADVGDSLIRVLRIDPKQYRLRLLNTSAIPNGSPITPKQWCQQNGLTAAINASMYQTDYKTSVSLMRKEGHINNPRLSKDMAILAFDRLDSGISEVKIIDRQCEDFEFWKKKYATLVQSIRMISCTGKNVWKQQPRRWSTSAIGTDTNNNVLFIHVRSLYSTHDLINILKVLPLNISRAMYTEGGPQAQLYIKVPNHEFEFVGSYEVGSSDANKGSLSWPLPNVIGISKRPPEPDQ
ncbi:MAG: phosphodiester glycosidase family protein [Deltaproteobacteria bacterium]|jgi:hypothetical protein|nr:phosphodiester glycosidase family protein [Deltaproteobacteria bacterium]